jgi:hypothetical protein
VIALKAEVGVEPAATAFVTDREEPLVREHPVDARLRVTTAAPEAALAPAAVAALRPVTEAQPVAVTAAGDVLDSLAASFDAAPWSAAELAPAHAGWGKEPFRQPPAKVRGVIARIDRMIFGGYLSSRD